MFTGPGLHFVLNSTSYLNGSTMLRTDIGEGAYALQCATDRVDCCRSFDGQTAGELYLPDGTLVLISDTWTYYRSRTSGAIRLNRRPNGNNRTISL